MRRRKTCCWPWRRWQSIACERGVRERTVAARCEGSSAGNLGKVGHERRVYIQEGCKYDTNTQQVFSAREELSPKGLRERDQIEKVLNDADRTLLRVIAVELCLAQPRTIIVQSCSAYSAPLQCTKSDGK